MWRGRAGKATGGGGDGQRGQEGKGRGRGSPVAAASMQVIVSHLTLGPLTGCGINPARVIGAVVYEVPIRGSRGSHHAPLEALLSPLHLSRPPPLPPFHKPHLLLKALFSSHYPSFLPRNVSGCLLDPPQSKIPRLPLQDKFWDGRAGQHFWIYIVGPMVAALLGPLLHLLLRGSLTPGGQSESYKRRSSTVGKADIWPGEAH